MIGVDLFWTPKAQKLQHAEEKQCGACKTLIKIISAIALAIFYVISAWLSPFFFAVGFVAGAIYSDEVKKRVTHVFKNISWKWLVPTTAILYGLCWPAAITMQGFLAGLDLGARWSHAARIVKV
jgi:hypothetical protein